MTKKWFLLAVVLALAACEPRERDTGTRLVPVTVDYTVPVVAAARAAGFTEIVKEAEILPTQPALGVKTLEMRVVPWRKWGRLPVTDHATAQELVAFADQYPVYTLSRMGVCAASPESMVSQGYMAVVSEGKKLGLWRNSCKWAVVVNRQSATS